MQLDFWNNPLVVSAMRLKYRRGSPGLTAALYVLTLLTVGSLLNYYQASLPIPWGRAFLLAIFSIQFALSALIALTTVGNSMNTEVNNRTLDFQRIVSLSPREILLGKMIGEPALSYFLAMATLPLVVICWLQGGATFPEILLFYLNLLTFTLMCAALGLLHTLSEPNQTPSKPRSGSIGGLFFVFLAFLPSIIMRGSMMNTNPWGRAALSLLAPIGPLLELKNGAPLHSQVDVWGIPLPALVIAPMVQLAVAAWFIQAMARRLENPIHTIFGRKDAYWVLTVVDLLIAGVCFTQWRRGWLPDELAAQFCFAHAATCLILLLGATPARTMLMTWLWRFRGQQSWSRDSLLFNRAETTLALLAMCGIGGGILLLGFVLPVVWSSPRGAAEFAWHQLFETELATVILVVATGMLCQTCQVVFGKSGITVFVLAVLMLNVVPPLTAEALESMSARPLNRSPLDSLYALSPAAFYSSRFGTSGRSSLPALPLMLAYLFIAIGSQSTFRLWLSRRSVAVNAKIGQMTHHSD